MSSATKGKERSSHRRPSASSKTGERRTSSSSGKERPTASSHRSAAKPEAPPAQLPRQRSNAGAAAPAKTGAPALPPPSSMRGAPAGAPAPAAKPAPPPAGATPRTVGTGAPAAAPPASSAMSPSSTAPRRVSAPAGTAAPVSPAGTAAAAKQPAQASANAMGGYGSMGANGYGSMGAGGYGSMGPGGYGPAPGMPSAMGGYGSMGPGMGSMNEMNGMGGYGSMGPGGYGSMGPGGYGSMGPGGMGGSVASGYGSMGGGDENAMNSMYGGANGANQMGSMYGMGGMPMGSMYGMGGPMGSMYGMGGPMGSMYGMGGMPMGSMYGMGGPMGGSMYGMGGPMGSMYGLGRYNSMGLGSTYGSMYGIGRSNSRTSFRSSGGYCGGSFGGLWRAPSDFEAQPKRDFSIPPPSSKLKEEMPEEKAPEKAAKAGAKDATPAAGAAAGATAAAASAADAKKTDAAADGKTRVVVVDQPDGKAPRKEGEVDKKEDGERGSRRGMPTAMPSSHRLTKQVNDNVHVIAVAASEAAVNRADKSVKVGGTPYKMDEVAVAPVDVDKSDLLIDIVEQTHCGHNVSMLALCGAQPFASCTGAITAVVKRMMETFAKDKSQVAQVRATAVAFDEGGNVTDLLDAAAKPAKVEMGSNPIFGPCVMNTSEKDVKSPEEAAAVVMDAAGKAGKQGLVVVMYKIKQIRPIAGAASTATPAKDVYVSSVLVAMADDANMQYLKVAEKHATSGAALLFTNAIGGASRTIAIVQVPEKDAEAQVKAAVAHAMVLREIKNTPTRSGNMKRFIDYTERAAAANTKASPETTKKIARMLKDAKELLARPEETPLAAYSLFTAAPPPSSTPAEAKKADAAAAPSPQAASAEAGAKPRAAPAGESKAAEAAPAAAAATATATTTSATPTAKVEAEKAVRLVVCVEGAAPLTAEQVHAHELVRRASTAEVPESATLKTLTANFGLGRNVALLSAETKPGVPLKEQYTWQSVSSILTATFEAPAAPAVKQTYVELFMAVVHKRQVLCDLMAPPSRSAAAKPLGTATSPLFGPILMDTVSTRLEKAADVKPTLEKALEAAAAHLVEPDAMLVMTAVLKQVKESKDVSVASFMAASGPSAAGVRGAMSKNPEYSRSLLAYALGGPCVTVLLVCVGDDHATSEAAKSSLADLHAFTKQPNHSSRDGSVMAFVDYAKKGLAANAAKLEKSSGEDKERLTAVARRLQLMHDDYSAVLTAPAETMPAYYMGDKRVSAASPGARGASASPSASPVTAAKAQAKSVKKEPPTKTSAPIRAVVVLLDGGDEPAAGAPVLTAAEAEITLGDKRYTPTELVHAKDGSIRSAIIDEVHKIVLGGYNAGMITNDVGGSTVGISMAVNNITVILRGLPSGSEAFWTVTVSKDNKVKDMLADNSPYYDLHLASSPLFGNVPYGANIVPITEAQVEPKVREVRNEVRENGGVGYIAVILRLAQADGDVCMPSFLVAIAGDSVAEYEKIIASRSSSALLGTAIGGPCNTVYVAGIRGKSGEAAQPVLEVAAKMSRVQNGPLRSGSLRRFIAHTEPALAIMQGKIEGNGGAPNQQLMAQVGRIGTMLKDAQSMLSSPGGSAPAVYKR